MTTSWIGFIGLGQMGQPIALNLQKAGFSLRVFDIAPERAAPLVAGGATQAAALHEVGAPGGIVISMVPEDRALLALALGEQGIALQLGQGGIHLSLSTISPTLSTRLAEVYARQGSSFLAATVLGRPDAAAKGVLSVFLSGDHSAKARVAPLLQAIGQRVYDLGEDGAAAAAAKLGANFLILAALEAMGEAAAFVERSGVERGLFLRMMVESPLFAGAVYEGYGAMIGAQDFSDARFPLPLGIKDAELVLRSAAQVDLPLPVAQLAHAHLLAAQADGRGREDWSVLAEYVAAPAAQVVGS